MPPLEVMLHDIGNPKPAEVAQALRVHRRTVERWIQDGNAPRPVMLALFWLTRWGMSSVECETFNLALMHAGAAALAQQQLKEAQARHAAEVEELELKLQRLGRIGDFGAANDPAPEVRHAVPALPVIAVPGQPRGKARATGSTGRNHRRTVRFHRAG
jgi:predicted DNA-binding transcriptional regulator AlpA